MIAVDRTIRELCGEIQASIESVQDWRLRTEEDLLREACWKYHHSTGGRNSVLIRISIKFYWRTQLCLKLCLNKNLNKRGKP